MSGRRPVSLATPRVSVAGLMSWLVRFGSVQAGLALPVIVIHPPDNDHFAHAYEVPSVPFTAHTDASRASRESGEPACAPAGPTLWYFADHYWYDSRYRQCETFGGKAAHPSGTDVTGRGPST